MRILLLAPLLLAGCAPTPNLFPSTPDDQARAALAIQLMSNMKPQPLQFYPLQPVPQSPQVHCLSQAYAGTIQTTCN